MSEFERLPSTSTEVSEMLDALSAWHGDDSGHAVQFYERDEFLIGEVSRFIGRTLGAGDAAVIIATQAHRDGIAAMLDSQGINTALAERQGRCVLLDASDTLARFMVAGELDRELFGSVLGNIIDSARKATGRDGAQVAAFGEMVALLWAEGKTGAAIQLEELWNGLAERHSFSLLCAYSIHSFSRREDSEPFLRVCAAHQRVLPAESYPDAAPEEDRRRVVAELQQKAQILEKESALRHSEERFRLLVDGVQEYAIYSLDANGIITSWNAGAHRIKGYTAEEIIGQHFSRFYTREDVQRGLPAQVLKIAREEGHYAGEGWRVRKDGSRFWSNVVVTPILDAAGHLAGFSKITRDMTDRKELLDRIQEHANELENAQQSLRRLSGQLLQVQDDERRRLARELHDGAGQILAALNMNLESLYDSIRGQIAPPLAQRLAESIRLADQVIKETRTLSYLLHPPLLDEAGLRDALHWFVGGFIERSGIQAELEISPEFARLPRELEIAIFRIIQEGLTNIHRHSGSSKAKIQLALHPGEVSVTIRDEGTGIPPSASGEELYRNRKLGVGIAGMRERVLQLGGRFEIVQGTPGTIVNASFPVRAIR